MTPRQSIVATKTKGERVSRHWSRFLISRSYLVVLANALASLAVWFFTFRHNTLIDSMNYWFRFILVPSGILLGMTVVFDLLVRSNRLAKRAEEYASLLLLLFYCLFLVIFHSITVVMLASFALPILLSTVFASVSVTRNTSIIALLMMVASAYAISLSTQRAFDRWIVIEAVSAAAILVTSYLLSKVLIRYGEDNVSVHNEKIDLEIQLQLDPLTDLYNRRAYSAYLPKAIADCSEGELDLSIAALDLDDFKQINDYYGHAAGDRVLLRLADLIRENVPDHVYAFRIGGEEFILLFEGYGTEVAVGVCERLLASMRSSRLPEIENKLISFSCGLAAVTATVNDPVALFSAADEALYSAKSGGKNQIVIFGEHMRANAGESLI